MIGFIPLLMTHEQTLTPDTITNLFPKCTNTLLHIFPDAHVIEVVISGVVVFGIIENIAKKPGFTGP